ncbi:MAG: Transcriptional regulator, BadM/Rrf2 family [Candidatus Beckwithbacteria bacterium GW2011_GWA2_47_25]|nr:MAG: hypothetical protein UY43_C0001G0076 [Candidatus Beckwithbacteria bacterium GW2011_GWC1_49_16]KKU35018.1 MAG: Transcriptional regulator, BadM/Rrf2 family [Candidatus Beckwithbacteria bacterium GW2011_GWA1_46_30]KKU71469.1 MAG: Transcriptional regulator, BadM/Rrf2 family [Candidatus Beckwithbacteria bacterium GW2011_GWA2_47_25]
MFRISRETDLGLLLMSELAQNSGSVGLKGWAKEKDLPYRFLSKVAVKLKKAGLIVSRQGRSGGYKLAKTAETISAGEVIRVFEGKTLPVGCMRGRDCVAEGFCVHKGLMGRVASVVDDRLDQVSLAELVRG